MKDNGTPSWDLSGCPVAERTGDTGNHCPHFPGEKKEKHLV